MGDLLYRMEVHEIIGAAMSVHRELGCGFTEKVYQDALEIEFRNNNISYVREPELSVIYKGEKTGTVFKPDFVCFDCIIVESKAVKELEDIHRSQAINYAKVSQSPLALLINFGELSLRFERLPNFNRINELKNNSFN